MFNLINSFFGSNHDDPKMKQGIHDIEPLKNKTMSEIKKGPIEKTATLPPVTDPFARDIEALENEVGELVAGLEIELELRRALELMPRERKRSDAYNALQKLLKSRYGVILHVGKRKKK